MNPPQGPGSLRRAVLGWRNTASVMLPVWFGLPFLAGGASRADDAWQDLAFVVLMFMAYCLGVLVVIPLFAFTVGRWLDRRSAPRGARSSAVTFGLYGFGFGVFLALLLGFSGLTIIGALVVILAPTVTAVGGRLLLELRGRAWGIILWVTFAAAVAAALALILTTLTTNFA